MLKYHIVAIHMFQCTKIGHLDVLNKLHIQDDTRHFAQILLLSTSPYRLPQADTSVPCVIKSRVIIHQQTGHPNTFVKELLSSVYSVIFAPSERATGIEICTNTIAINGICTILLLKISIFPTGPFQTVSIRNQRRLRSAYGDRKPQENFR